MFSIGSVVFNPNYPGIVAITSTIATVSRMVAAAVSENPIFSLPNVTLFAISVTSWGYTLSTKSSEVFAKTMKANATPQSNTPVQKFQTTYKQWYDAKKNIEAIKALSKSEDLCDASVLIEEEKNFKELELKLRTLFNALPKSEQDSYWGLPFLKDHDE